MVRHGSRQLVEVEAEEPDHSVVGEEVVEELPDRLQKQVVVGEELHILDLGQRQEIRLADRRRIVVASKRPCSIRILRS